MTKSRDTKSEDFLRGHTSRQYWRTFSLYKLENRFFGCYPGDLTENGVGCPMESTFGMIQRAFKIFGWNKMSPSMYPW